MVRILENENPHATADPTYLPHHTCGEGQDTKENVYWGEKEGKRIPLGREDFAQEASLRRVDMQYPTSLQENVRPFSSGCGSKNRHHKGLQTESEFPHQEKKVLYAGNKRGKARLSWFLRMIFILTGSAGSIVESIQEEGVIKKYGTVWEAFPRGKLTVVLEHIFPPSSAFLEQALPESLNYKQQMGVEFQAVTEKITREKD